MTRAGSKLVLRTSPAPGHYLCIKWDFASLPLGGAPVVLSCVTIRNTLQGHDSSVHCGSGVQRLVAKTLDVERETALVVGSDNVLLGSVDMTNGNCKQLPEWGAFPVVRLSIR